MRGLSPHEGLSSRREPLIRLRFAPAPSPTRGEGRKPAPTCMCDLLCDCPTGKSLLIFRNRVKPRNQKYSASRQPQITPTTPAIPRPQEGRIAIVTDVGCGERWPQSAGRATRFSQGGLMACERRPRADERRCCGRQSRVVLAPVAGVKPAEVLRDPTGFRQSLQSAGDGGKRNSSPGRARYKP
jgi:hypothetical protein